MKDFHSEPFDEGTRCKLEIFRGYVREWLPVFLGKGSKFTTVAVYDFFAGPGTDVNGEKGSPLIIAEEVQAFIRSSTGQHACNRVNLYFNDDEPPKAAGLSEALGGTILPEWVSIVVDNRDFGLAFERKLSAIDTPNTANLVILDQCGVKHITSDVFCRLVTCKVTDILFFISSAIIKRFAGEGVIAQYFPGISKDKIDKCDARQIHRLVCDYYRSLIPAGKEYYLAPFSIKKGANVYGLIFGSGNLRGLEKFLRVCWDIDPYTGEATYNIDNDVFRKGGSLFADLNVVRKKDEFYRNLIARLAEKPLTNREVYRYALENGFLPKHATETLRELRKAGKLAVAPETPPNAFYVNWECFSGKDDRVVVFSLKG